MYDYLPDDPAGWLADMVSDVVWADDPIDQMSANVTLFIISLIANFVSLGATIVLSFVFAFFFAVGLTRFIIQ